MASSTVETSAVAVLAYLWHYESYGRLAAAANTKLMRMRVDVPGTHSTYQLGEVRST
jgi:hypothetical protein